MMRVEICELVLAAMRLTNEVRQPHQQLRIDSDAPVFGLGSPLDSLGLVGLLVDIEDGLRERGIDVELSDARAMSPTRSPFKDVPSLVDHIDGLITQRA